MKYIIRIYKKFLTYFKKANKQTDKELDYVGSLSFSLCDNTDIDIRCAIPETKNKSINEITLLAEQYAEFLLHINNGLFQDNIINILKNKNNNRSVEDQLFVDNVLVFWAMLSVEYSKKRLLEDNAQQPLIRPSIVFKNS